MIRQVMLFDEFGGPTVGGFVVLSTPDRQQEVIFHVPAGDDFKQAENDAASQAFDYAEQNDCLLIYADGSPTCRSLYFLGEIC